MQIVSIPMQTICISEGKICCIHLFRTATAVPLPFEIYATVKTVKYEVLEKNLHKTIDRLSDLRIRQNREFFNISPAMALDLIRDIANLIDDAEIEERCWMTSEQG